MLLSIALSTARRSRGLAEESLPPSLAATVISRIRRVEILPRFASAAAFLCLMFAHLLWPAMPVPRPRLVVATNYTGGCVAPSQQAVLLEELREHRETHFAVVDLEHALLDGERQRHQLG